MSDGWKYINGAPVWRPSVELAMAQITSGLYGEEYEELRAELEDLVAAVRRECAAQIRAERDEQYGPLEFKAEKATINRVADLIDLDKGES
ncbi:hypothetical protein ACWCO0_09605 [Streptomyces tubercidicus]